MHAAALPAELLDTLSACDTPTICNALEVVAPQRRGFGYTTHSMVVARPDLKPMVGFARTATYRSMTPPDRPAPEMAAQRAAYYAYVEAGGQPGISVLQDLDPEPGYGAFWGEVNSTIHSSLGAVGGITNGSIRDLDALAPGFQLIAGRIGPSHAHGHLVDFACEVEVLGMTVRDGDLIHADRHGAVVIPVEVAEALPDAVDLIVRREQVILDACRQPGFNAEKLKQAMADSADIH
jgi:regulator of RNase E activity RraA